MPGIRYDIEMSFKDQVKTKAFWQMYIALFRLNQEKILLGRRVPWRFWTVASLEGHYTYDWHSSHDVARGKVDASCGQFQYFIENFTKE